MIKEVLSYFWLPIVVVLLMFLFNPVKDCSKIPENQRYKYAVMSDNPNKCIKMSNQEIEKSKIEDIENKNRELEWENCKLKNFDTEECKQLKEDKEFILNIINKVNSKKEQQKIKVF